MKTPEKIWRTDCNDTSYTLTSICDAKDQRIAELEAEVERLRNLFKQVKSVMAQIDLTLNGDKPCKK